MEIKQIKQIIDLMKRAELCEFAVEEEGFKLKIRRGAGGMTAGHRHADSPVARSSDATGHGALPPTTSDPVDPKPDPVTTPEIEAGVSYIKSPMVGTFYRSPSPDSKPFVDSGSNVTESSVVCIIEAMKIMNEIQADTKGAIVKILVEDGEPVEYGQDLFKVKNG